MPQEYVSTPSSAFFSQQYLQNDKSSRKSKGPTEHQSDEALNTTLSSFVTVHSSNFQLYEQGEHGPPSAKR